MESVSKSGKYLRKEWGKNLGLTCKPIGNFASVMRRMENKLAAEKIENKVKNERKRTKELGAV